MQLCLCNSSLLFLINQKQAQDFPISLPGKSTSGLKPKPKISSGKETISMIGICKDNVQTQDNSENSSPTSNLAG